MNKDEILSILTNIENSVSEIKLLLNKSTEDQVSKNKLTEDRSIESYQLSNGIKLVDTNWPLAVPEESIVRTKLQEITRAKMMASKLPNISGKILDFGCGKGYLTEYYHDNQQEIIGYDPYPTPNEWETKNCTKFYSNWDNVIELGPYDSIVMYDVIDHIVDRPLIDIVNDIKLVMNKDSTLYVFAHPWTGPHGGHLYEFINKAYAHLLINKEFLNSICPDRTKCVEILKPQSHYKTLFEDNFKVKDKKAFNQPPNSWVVENLVPILLNEVFDNKTQQDQLIKIISLAGIYYQLTNN